MSLASPRLLRRLGPAALVVMSLAGCSAFDQQWQHTPMPAAENPASPLSGKWEGTWQSDSTAYEGLMQAIIVPMGNKVEEGKPVQQYKAQMKMYLYLVASNEQAVTLNIVPAENGRWHLWGKIDRGTYFGGIHNYDGYIDGDNFFCDYTSDKDCGTFKMHRLVGVNQ